MRLVQWLAMCLVSVGTWVRFPGPPIILILFFSMLSCADSKIRCTISLTSQRSKCPQMQIQRMKGDEYHVLSQSMLQAIKESQQALFKWASNLNPTPSNSSHTPLGFNLPFFIFVIFLFYLPSFISY